MSVDTSSGFLAGIEYDSAPGRDEEAERQASSDRLASALVRRTVMRHDSECWSRCRHRNCLRDRKHLRLILEALDLADEPARPEDYRRAKLAWHSISRSEIAWMQGKHV